VPQPFWADNEYYVRLKVSILHQMNQPALSLLCHRTCGLAAAGGSEISPHDLFDRVKAVARGGFTGMGFGDRDLRYWLTKYDIGELRQLLDDSGIRHIELEASSTGSPRASVVKPPTATSTRS
jgi:hypothetical protein